MLTLSLSQGGKQASDAEHENIDIHSSESSHGESFGAESSLGVHDMNPISPSQGKSDMEDENGDIQCYAYDESSDDESLLRVHGKNLVLIFDDLEPIALSSVTFSDVNRRVLDRIRDGFTRKFFESEQM